MSSVNHTARDNRFNPVTTIPLIEIDVGSFGVFPDLGKADMLVACLLDFEMKSSGVFF